MEYNNLGELIYRRDRSGIGHTFKYDAQGHMTSDAADFPTASGVESSVKQHTFDFDALGRLTFATSKATVDGTVLNQVGRTYDGLGNLKVETTSSNGAIDGGSATVTYLYQTGDNANRLTTMIYPDGREVGYDYDTQGRVSAVTDMGDTVESYTYLGAGAILGRTRPLAGLEQSGGGPAPDAGLDAFNRVVAKVWTKGDDAADAFAYGYDADGHLLYKDNQVNWSFSDLYQVDGASAAAAYDGQGMLVEFQRGILGTTGGATRPNLISSGPSTQLDQTWGHFDGNHQRNMPPDATTDRPIYQGALTPAQVESAGLANSAQPARALTVRYDAWGQMINLNEWTVAYGSIPGGGDGPDIPTATATAQSGKQFGYDALGRRIAENGVTPTAANIANLTAANAAANGVQLVYDQAGNAIQEAKPGTFSAQYLYSPDGQLIARDWDSDNSSSTSTLGAGGSLGLDKRLYALQDDSGNVTAVTDEGGNVVERYLYSPEGKLEVRSPDWSAVRNGPSDQWRLLFQGNRVDATGIYRTAAGEWDYLTGGTLHEDAKAYSAARNAYSEWTARNAEVPDEVADPHGIARASRWVGIAALSVATAGWGATLLAGGLGAGFGAADAWLGGTSMIDGAISGSEFGMGLAGIASMLPKAVAFWGGVTLNAGMGGYGVYDSLSHDRYAQGFFRTITSLFAAGAQARQLGFSLKIDGFGANGGNIRLVRNKTFIQENEVTTYADADARRQVGDNLEAHELWQHANLRENGLATERLSTPASQNNPVIALDRVVHRQVTQAQNAWDASAMTPLENIDANAAVLRLLDAAPESDISRLQQMAVTHAQSLGF